MGFFPPYATYAKKKKFTRLTPKKKIPSEKKRDLRQKKKLRDLRQKKIKKRLTLISTIELRFPRAIGAPRSANRQGEEQHRHTERGSYTRRDKGEHSKQGGGAQQGRRGNQNSGNREPEWSGWQSVRVGGSDNKGDGLASQPRRYRVPGQPLLNPHQVEGVSCSADVLFAQQEREPIRGRPAVRGKRTYGGRPGQHVEEQGTWASRTQKHSEAGYGWPVDRGAWTAKTVK